MKFVVSCAVIAALAAGLSARAQERTEQSVVDQVVDQVCRRQIVLLGELPSHGEALAFDAKSKIVTRLVERCGFKAILFEAPIYDFLGLARPLEQRTAAPEQLDNAIGRFWWTRELAPWRRSLFDIATKQGVRIGGLDDQVSITSRHAIAELPRLVAASFPGGRATECREAVTRNLAYSYDAAHPFDDNEKLKLQQCARESADASAGKSTFDPRDRAMLENFGRYADRQRSSTAMNRDESMFRNLAWYVDRLPANTRVVIWTATVHAARQRGPLADLPLGARAVERWGDRVASVGFTAYSGSTSRAGRPPAPIADAPPESLEATASHDSAWTLLNGARLRATGRPSSRLLGRFGGESWSDFFDFVIVIRQEVAPTFDPWK